MKIIIRQPGAELFRKDNMSLMPVNIAFVCQCPKRRQIAYGANVVSRSSQVLDLSKYIPLEFYVLQPNRLGRSVYLL